MNNFWAYVIKTKAHWGLFPVFVSDNFYWYSEEVDTHTLSYFGVFFIHILPSVLWRHFYQYDYLNAVGVPFWRTHVWRPKVA